MKGSMSLRSAAHGRVCAAAENWLGTEMRHGVRHAPPRDDVMPNRNAKRTRQRQLLSAEDVIRILHAEIEKAGSQTAWARRTGANRSSLNLALTGRQPVTRNLLDALGLERVVAFTPRRR